MGNLSYYYKGGSNQLQKVTDAAADATTNYSLYNDIRQGQLDNNYQYDATGNLTGDASEGISNIGWTVYGKISSITKGGSTINYSYDASGNRLIKSTAIDTTVYVRDGSGNVMSVYVKKAGGSLVQAEMPIYGSSRLGMATQHTAPDTSLLLAGGFGTAIKSTFTRGEKFFELSNHLGNVLATLTDRRMQNSAAGVNVDYYTADIMAANDYYLFGMQMPGRRYQAGSSSYRYGFNGKENDNEMSGSGNQYDYGFRIYNPRIGRFLSIDPLTKTYPWYTPYQFAGNKPIWATDVDGLEENTTSTYVYKAPLLSTKPAFKGIISITDATSQIAHKTFEGDFTKLAKGDHSAIALVNALVGSNVGDGSSRLEVTMTGQRSQLFKSWKGTDMKYFTQFSYSFTSGNVVEKGNFEMQNGSAQVSARAWDPLTFLLLNKVISSVFTSGITIGQSKAMQSTTIEALEGSQKVYNGAKLYRLGTSGISKTGTEAQFWSLENPLTMGVEEYAKKYGINLKNVQNADFVETATLKEGAKYITREAPTMEGAPAGAGGGMEVVVEKGGTTSNIITPIKR